MIHLVLIYSLSYITITKVNFRTFSSPLKKLIPTNIYILSSFNLQPQPTTNYHSFFSVNLPFLGMSYEWNHNIFKMVFVIFSIVFCEWLLTIIFWRLSLLLYVSKYTLSFYANSVTLNGCITLFPHQFMDICVLLLWGSYE